MCTPGLLMGLGNKTEFLIYILCFLGGGSHPVYDGYVVCEENAEALMDAWNAEQEEKIAREESKREKRVLDNWKKLVKGLMFREKMKNKYLKE